LWVGTDDGLWYLDGAGKQFVHFQPAGGKLKAVQTLARARVFSVLESHDDRLWIGTASGLFVLSPARRIVAWLRYQADDPTSLSSSIVTSVLEDGDGTIWVGTFGGGLDRLDPAWRGWKAEHIVHDSAHPDGLSANAIMTLFKDATGLVWIGTYGGGFDIYNPRSAAFGSIGQGAGKTGKLTGKLVRAIAGDGHGHLWVGTEQGLTRFDKQGENAKLYPLPAISNGSGSGQSIRAIYSAPDSTLWVGTRRNGLLRMTAASGKFVRVPLTTADHQQHDQRHIRHIFMDRQGRLWVATSWGLWQLDPASGAVLARYLPSKGADALPSPEVTTMCQTRDGSLWVGTMRGLRRFDGPQARFALPTLASGQRDVLGASNVLSCLPEPDGSLWVGTADGLFRYWPNTGRVKMYGVFDGLPSMTIYALLRDKSGKVWASTDRGLARIDPVSGRIRNYGRPDGLSNEEFNQLAAYAAPDGVLYFGGTEGVSVVFPAHLDLNKTRARVGITGYSLMGRDSRQVAHGLPRAPLQVKYWQNILTFDVAVFDFAAPQDDRFRYRLQGFDSAWHNLAHRHSITYTNLDAGHYVLQVQGIDSSGRQAANTATLALVVQSPPWLSFWAWVIYVAVGLLLVAAGLAIFAAWVRRRRDLVSEQQRRRWAESLHDLVHVVSRLNDEHSIAIQLVQRLPALIPHTCSAFMVGCDGVMNLVTTRGFDTAATERLQAWARRSHDLLTDLAGQDRISCLDGAGLHMPGDIVMRKFMVLPLRITDAQCHLLLIGRDDAPFDKVEMDLAAVLARQVRVVLDKAGLIAQLQQLAHVDSLTGASSRGWFMQQAEAEFERCRRYRHPLSVLLVDVDHFKRVNDTHGHAAGDAVLAALVERCHGQLRAPDLVGRYGGEEFTICLPETSLSAALALAERLRENIAATPADTPVGPVAVSVSIGVAGLVPSADDSLEALIVHADKALYVAKRDGRNRVCGPAQTMIDPA
ncbi:MAG TPA: diguanylate cyclase, partial [Rhodanobacteraceae bacterium]